MANLKFPFNWECNLCGAYNLTKDLVIQREAMNCRRCKATWRTRAVAKAVCVAVNRQESKLHKLEPDYSLFGLGIGDSTSLSVKLFEKFHYTNTHIDKFPYFNLKENIESKMKNIFDFVCCSEVLEHVAPPIDEVFKNIYDLLKLGGAAVISVPLVKVSKGKEYKYHGNKAELLLKGDSEEYYPGLVNFHFENNTLIWTDGKNEFKDEMPEIHGGDGLTLTFRRWSLDQLKLKLTNAGFSQVFSLSDVSNERIYHAEDAGVIIARK